MSTENWDKNHYRECRAFMKFNLEHRPWCMKVDDPFEWAKVFLPLISQAIHKEDFEAAQGFNDAMRTFLNRFLTKENKITSKDILRLPEFEEIKVHGIVCLGDPNDPTGIGSGGAITL